MLPWNRSPMCLGLAAQGIDPKTGTPVGQYVVCQTHTGTLPNLSNHGNAVLGRGIRQLLRIPHQVRTFGQHERPALDARMGHCG